jgi:hypothetical protein
MRWIMLFGIIAASVLLVSAKFPQPKEIVSQEKQLAIESWKTFDLGYFSFKAPKDMKFVPTSSIDSEGWRYRNNAIRLDIDFGIYSNSLSLYYKQIDYREESISIDGRKAKLCLFRLTPSFTTPADGKLTFIAAIYFPDTGLGEKLTFWANCKGPAEQEMAKAIFQSIKFK